MHDILSYLVCYFTFLSIELAISVCPCHLYRSNCASLKESTMICKNNYPSFKIPFLMNHPQPPEGGNTLNSNILVNLFQSKIKANHCKAHQSPSDTMVNSKIAHIFLYFFCNFVETKRRLQSIHCTEVYLVRGFGPVFCSAK